MESAPARAQSRIPPFRLSKTVQPAPHKGQRRWLPHFSGQSSSADAKNGAKKRVFPKCLLSPRGTRAAGHRGLDTHNAACGIETRFQPQCCRVQCGVSTHTMLRAALKPDPPSHTCRNESCLDTHNAACGIGSKTALRVLSVTQSRFRMQKAHSNLDDAAHRC